MLINWQSTQFAVEYLEDKVKVAQVDIDTLPTAFKLLQEPVGLASNWSFVVACFCLGLYHLTSYLGRRSRRRIRYILSAFDLRDIFNDGWPFLVKFLVLIIASMMV